MADQFFCPSRRHILGVLGAAASSSLLARTGMAEQPQRLGLQAKRSDFGWPSSAAMSQGWSSGFTPVWSLGTDPAPRFRPGSLDLTVQNDLPAPAALLWRGLGGVPAAEPLLGRSSLAPGGRDTLQLPLRHAGTMFCDLGLLGDGAPHPSRGQALIVNEAEPVAVDRDDVLVIEEWRVRKDGSAIGPGVAPGDAEVFHTINGSFGSDLLGGPIRANARWRLRFVNASHRSVVAVKLENTDVRVIAIDSRPAEPFSARNGALVLAPGSRVDALVDMTGPPGTKIPIFLHDGKQAHRFADLAIGDGPPVRPAPLPPAAALPADGLPDKLDLKGAQRVDLALDGPDWVPPARFAASAAPAFQAKAGRAVVVALTNRAPIATVFHLHGHHFRLLDRLDDGWKPYWLDTLALEPGQIQRIAFAAETAGRFLIESVATDWAAPRLLRWYEVR